MNEILDDLCNLRYNRRYRVWEPFMRKYDCQVICEIGVRWGINLKYMIQHKPKLAVAIDIWRNDGNIARNDIDASQKELDRQYEEVMSGPGSEPFVKVYREYSFEAVKRFPDNFFDLVYIDADHTFEGCYKDIIDWYPKVKPGKFLLGDDFREHKTKTGVRFGVIKAVRNFTLDNNLGYFVFPRMKWGITKK